MKKALIFVSLFFLVSVTFGQSVIEDFPLVKGRYFGQKLLKVPELFAPGIISFDDMSNGCSAFNHNGTVFVFKRVNSPDSVFIYVTELKKGVWTKPYKAPFESKYYEGDFTFSPDGKKLYISSRRPVVKGGEEGDSNIWVVEYNKGQWGRPYMLSKPVNTDRHESYPSVAKNGNLYFFYRDRGGYGKSDLCYSEFQEPRTFT